MNKKIFYSFALAVAAFSMTGCADSDLPGFFVNKTDSIQSLAYLNDYDALKTYVNRSANPNFKLGVALGAQNYVDHDITYRLANNNFDELTAGNAMKYASCVKEDGSMDFSLVHNFVQEATDAGMSVFGHTLAWHSQQQPKYLNGLLKDKELPPDPTGGNKYLKITLGDAGANQWDKQIAYKLAQPLEKGADYVMSVKVKASQESGANFAAWPIWEASTNKNQWGGSNDVQYMATYDVGTEYTTLTWEFNANFPIDKLQFVFGKVGGTLECDDFTLKKAGSDENLIANGDFSKESTSGWSTTNCGVEVGSAAAAVEVETEVNNITYTDGPFPFYAMGCEPPVVNGAIHFVPTGDWFQFFICPGSNNALDEGNYTLYLDVTSTEKITANLNVQNGWESDADKKGGSITIPAGRNKVKVALPGIKGGNYDIILQPGTANATLDIHGITICKIQKLNSIPLTPEEKKEILTAELGKWIDGMMEACDGKVTSWDVVNEAISGADTDGDGIYDLQHAATASETDKANNFYWQDYLGDLDYVRTAVKLARESFVAHNGNAADLKLFINDYSLETFWDNNKKLESLIEWIKRWESDGVTKIDGIASQMHVTYFADADLQKKQEDAIENMLRLMAATGKLVKISELDMGYNNTTDIFAAGLQTKELNDAQQKQMADFYQFIVKKYFEIVPANQRYGICQWCITDSPADSGWRKGEPVGLWTEQYDRKRAYGGFADGLKEGSPVQ